MEKQKVELWLLCVALMAIAWMLAAINQHLSELVALLK